MVVVLWVAVHELVELEQSQQLGKGSEEVGPRAVRHWVETHLDQLLLEVSVPQVLDLIVGPPGKVHCDCRPPEWIRVPLGLDLIQNGHKSTWS